ncbi:MAG: SMI1/KNR4 family protein [Capnocytophaga endodontalis]
MDNIKKLYNLMPEDCKGFSETQLLKAEKRLLITLPEEFRAYYLELGATKSVNQSYNSLAKPQQLYFEGDYLCFCEENQGVVMWAIRKEDLNNPNPSVWGNYGSETDPNWIQETKNLSDFWLYMAIYNGVMGGLPYNANAMGGWDMEGFEVPTEAVAHIEKQYTELTSLSWEGQRTFIDANFQIVITLSIYQTTNRATAIFIGSTQQELFDTLLDAMENFGLQWDYTSYDDES